MPMQKKIFFSVFLRFFFFFAGWKDFEEFVPDFEAFQAH